MMSKLAIVPIGILDCDKGSFAAEHEFFVKRRVDWLPKVADTVEHHEM